MKKSLFLVGIFCLQACLSAAAQTLQFKVDWPEGTAGGYTVLGAEPPANRINASGTFTAHEGDKVRVVGSGFDASFSVLEGKIHFAHNEPPKKSTGIRIDATTNTVSFVTEKISAVRKNLPFPITLFGQALSASASPGGSGSETVDLKIARGKHTLAFGTTKVTFIVDDSGRINIENAVRGVTVDRMTISVEGQPYQVVTPSPNWKIAQSTAPQTKGNAAVYLLPGSYGFQDAGKGKLAFVVNDDGLLALSDVGPFAEVVSLADAGGAPVAKIMIPDGEAKMEARLQQNARDQAAHDKALAGSSAAAWKQDFSLVEHMKVYDFPEEQLAFPVTLPAGANASSLTLLAFTDTTVRAVPFQLKRTGDKTTLYLRSDLPRGATRLFRLVSGFEAAGVPAAIPVPPTVKSGASPHEAVLGNGRLTVAVAAGHQDFPGGKPLSQVPGTHSRGGAQRRAPCRDGHQLVRRAGIGQGGRH